MGSYTPAVWLLLSICCSVSTGALVRNCTFQKDYGIIIAGDFSFCGFTQSPGFSWRTANTDTSTGGTGPSQDHTGPHSGFSRGYYAYTDSSLKQPGTIRTLSSPIWSKSAGEQGGCVQLWYHMYGADIGSLNISVYENTANGLVANLQIDGNQGNMWKPASLNLNPPSSPQQLQLVIQTITAGGYGANNKGDIAIDDLIIYSSGACPTPATTPTSTSTQAYSSTTPSSDGSWFCDFETTLSNPWCSITRASQGISWIRTLSTLNGVSARNSTTPYFVYIQGLGSNQNSTATLELPHFSPNQYRCLRFYYNKPGTGVLRAYADVSGSYQEIWSQTGSPGSGWIVAFINLPSSSVKVMIEGERGENADDIHVDDIKLTTTTCTGGTVTTVSTTQPTPPTTRAQPRLAFACGFNSNKCNLYQDGGNDFDWTRLNTPTWSSNTGPSADHSYGNLRGYYMYTETSFKKNGWRASLSSGYITVVGTPCLRFAYHMFGPHIGDLNVSVKRASDDTVVKSWSKTGNQSSVWQIASLDFSVTDNGVYYINIESIIRYSGPSLSEIKGDIAIDDIILTLREPCSNLDLDRVTSDTLVSTTTPKTTSTSTASTPSRPSTPSTPTTSSTTRPTTTQPSTITCSFDRSDICNFVQDSTDDFDWARLNYKTWSGATGPTSDHTKGNDQGWFMYIEASYKMHDTRAILKSPTLYRKQSQDMCVSFWYHMYGRDIGTLNVKVTTEVQSDVTIFIKGGNQGDQWRQAQITLRTDSSTVRVDFEGWIAHKLGSLAEVLGDIAIDDFALDFNAGCANPDNTTVIGNIGTTAPGKPTTAKSSTKSGMVTVTGKTPGSGTAGNLTLTAKPDDDKGGSNVGAIVGATVAVTVSVVFVACLIVMRQRQLWLFSPGSRLSKILGSKESDIKGIYNGGIVNETYDQSRPYQEVNGTMKFSDA